MVYNYDAFASALTPVTHWADRTANRLRQCGITIKDETPEREDSLLPQATRYVPILTVYLG